MLFQNVLASMSLSQFMRVELFVVLQNVLFWYIRSIVDLESSHRLLVRSLYLKLVNTLTSPINDT